MFNALVSTVVSSGNVGAMVLLAVMTVTIVWCLVQQVMYRFGHAWSPVNAYAVSLFILATGAFAVILLHPTSTVPAREGLTMTICFMIVTVAAGCWSVFANLLAARIRRLHADER